MLKKIKKLLEYNIKTLIKFELLYKIISIIIFVPLFLNIFKLITRLIGYNYLTLENIIPFLTNPLTIIFLLLLIVLLTFYTLIDISTIIIILDSSYQNIKISVKDAFMLSLRKSLKVFQLKNIMFPFLIVFLIPFLNIGLSSGFINTIKLPEFILDFINNNKTLLFLYTILLILLVILLLKWIYSIHYFVLENSNFKEARKKSIKLSKKNLIKDFFLIITTQIIIAILYIIFIVIGIFIIVIIYKWLGNKNILSNISITIIWLLIAISFIIANILNTPLSYSIISTLFYNHKEKNNEKIVHIDINKQTKTKNNKLFKVFKYVVIILIIISSTLFTYSILNGKYDLKIEYLRLMEVTAHRGASVLYPENTMSAFKGAKELGADWIELDVQQTKDKEIIVLHDTNLKRTTGINKNTWLVTYDEIKDLDAGSFFNEEFKNERIPLLKNVIKYAKENNLKLNIELKPTGKEEEFEKSVIDIIHEYNFTSNCVVTSQNYEVLKNVKKYDNNIKTIYVMSFAYGDILNLDKADGFSIEASSINKTLVKNIHNSGKEIYAWTVNTPVSINNMIDLNVDNIITDNISLAKDTIYNSKTSNVIKEFIKKIEKLLK